MIDDSELLRLYVEDGSDEAFRELVRRRVALVYSAAFRQLRDAHRAREVVQSVFTDLARKAGDLYRRPVLISWLYTSAHFAATNLLRAEFRQRTRDREAYLMHEANSGSISDADWDKLRPALDQEMHRLKAREREAILLRYFDEVSFARIGQILHLSEGAARKRVERALERLRSRLAKQGITSTAAALAAMLAGQSGLAAPPGFVEAVAGSALISAAQGRLAPMGLLKIMSTKSTLGVAGALGLAGFLTFTGIGTAIYEFRAAQHDRADLAIAQREYQSGQARLRELVRSAELAEGRVRDVQGKLAQSRTAAARAKLTTASVRGPQSGRDPKMDAKNFLATFGQVQGMLAEVGRAQLERTYGPFYRSAGLTPKQIAEFESRTSAYFLELGPVMTPNSLNPSISQLPDDQLRQILGDDGFVQFQAYNRMLPAYNFTLQVATQAGSTAEPLSVAQFDQLAQIVATNSSAYQQGGKLDPSAVDWSAVASQAKALLSAAQWQAANGAFSSQQLNQAVAQASNP